MWCNTVLFTDLPPVCFWIVNDFHVYHLFVTVSVKFNKNKWNCKEFTENILKLHHYKTAYFIHVSSIYSAFELRNMIILNIQTVLGVSLIFLLMTRCNYFQNVSQLTSCASLRHTMSFCCMLAFDVLSKGNIL